MNSFEIDEHISFPINGNPAPGHLVVPDRSGPMPAIVVIQEVFGLNDDIRDIARKFASQGYVTLAPDLYHGEESIDLEEARKFRMAMNMEQAEQELDSAVRYLRALQYDPVVPGLRLLMPRPYFMVEAICQVTIRYVRLSAQYLEHMALKTMVYRLRRFISFSRC